ncbi:hypothetical protein MESS2_1260004 [Mesorhizobium metallidurans STM 2683]|uniref:Microcystin LR degradation protein MlrC N-terminal domain-containing protein n=1 Tax=Mesorhizobium metallidurans STM 2683 TaxID=1297569 RepID=M5EJQ6_9HYPH|nr:hypothetical protein MESS2_1260004 [Mesorhizobium metallidurans STM 2683]
MRVFTASLATETNTFSPVSTDRSSFEMAFYAPPGKHPETPTLCSAPIPALRRRARDEGFTLIEGTATWAEPGGSFWDGQVRRGRRGRGLNAGFVFSKAALFFESILDRQDGMNRRLGIDAI